ncbi:restriction endonuclease subunit S [Pseudomonas hefeiensis]|uniref:Restriction endonuclease subunit S n=1 Tax=Pseudomonas hefeiensis TaxID=2738125 RepID=A0ABY9GCW6_9PSED|nr:MULTISPECIES: restriction endonuclease subunit S [unclassified Pseudomonas]WLH13512.1 restriction endonuclease subunit S [Pseudomonas sp. FP205]WLH96570.1 restriction endonuclease subunit S [Pseudomonas sp. FP53]WLI40847.1 restriction endonuclease subunit S [Pseudomonas sp. FP821]
MSGVSFLERLLDGVVVEWLPLGDVTKYEQPTKYLVATKNYSDDFETPVLTAGKTFVLGYTDEAHGIYKASETPVIIFDDFTTANKWVDFDFKAKSSAMKMITSSDEGKTLIKYIYFWLNTLPSELVDGDHKRQWISNYACKKIPIPCPENPKKSLEIQAEIVRILDIFTEMTAELTAELTARKKQYNYYRDQLLSFKNRNVEWKALCEVGEFIRGKRFTKADYVEDGISVIHYGEIYTRYGVFTTQAFSQVRNNMAGSLRYAEPGDVVITDVGETVDDVGKAVAWLGDEKVAIHDHCYAFRHSMNPKFVSYCMQATSFVAEKAKYIARTKVNTLLVNGFSKIKIPVPYPDDLDKSLAEQARIVAILDKLYVLTNSVSKGLPCEIALRQKQYAYYRDLLLSFPRPEEVAA